MLHIAGNLQFAIMLQTACQLLPCGTLAWAAAKRSLSYSTSINKLLATCTTHHHGDEASTMTKPFHPNPLAWDMGLHGAQQAGATTTTAADTQHPQGAACSHPHLAQYPSTPLLPSLLAAARPRAHHPCRPLLLPLPPLTHALHTSCQTLDQPQKPPSNTQGAAPTATPTAAPAAAASSALPDPYAGSRFMMALPPAARPYAALMRLDKPIGTWLLLWPCLWWVPGDVVDCCFWGCGV